MKNLTTQESSSRRYQTSKTKSFFGALLLSLLLSFVIMPKQINAFIVGTDVSTPTITIFNEVTWTTFSTATLVMVPPTFSILGATAVTWNPVNGLYYIILRVTPGGPTARRLATVNPETGVCTDIGSMGAAFSSLTFSPTGTLYAMGGDGSPTFAQELCTVSLITGVPTYLAGPFSLGADGEVIAYNSTDGLIYHWSGNTVANMETILPSPPFTATPVVQSGVTHGEIFGAAYTGGGIFIASDILNRGLTITSTGVVAIQAAGPLLFEPRGLGFGDPLLPVELSSFISSISGNDVTLNWSTASETNNSGFEIERSIVNSQWSRIGIVQGNGTTSSSNSYSFVDRNLSSGIYNYRLKQIDFNGNFEYFNLSNEVGIGIPTKYDLSQNYPNPFNPTTNINYDIPFDGKVNIKLYDISGKEVATLVNNVQTAGYYSINFNGSNLSSGAYFYRVSADGNGQNFVATKKMVLVK